MQRVIELKHKVCDFNCMLSGLEDMIEKQYQLRLPEYLLFIGGYIGFKYEIQPHAKIPRLVEPGYGVGRIHYQFLADIFQFDWHISEGEDFQTAWSEIKQLLDLGNPVIAGELDMFHLPYLKKFYQRIHVPFHYVTIIGYDDEKQTVLIQDCSRQENQEISMKNLEKALSQDVNGLCKRNTFFWFGFNNKPMQMPIEQLIKAILQKKGDMFLKDDRQGLTGLNNLIQDFPNWEMNLSANQFQKCLKHLVTYTCSNTPMLPQKLIYFKLDDIFKKHHSLRDRFAALLNDIDNKFGINECGLSAEHFQKSGFYFQELTDIITDYLASIFKTSKVKSNLAQVPLLLDKIKEEEKKGFTILSQINTDY